MKKVFLILLCIAFLFLAACGSLESTVSKNNTEDDLLEPPEQQSVFSMLLYREGNKMINRLQLQQLRNVDITQVDHNTLVDIRNVHIDSSLPAAKKMQSYFEQIINPYCFLCGDTPVRIRFASEGKTLKQSLCDYFLSLK